MGLSVSLANKSESIVTISPETDVWKASIVVVDALPDVVTAVVVVGAKLVVKT